MKQFIFIIFLCSLFGCKNKAPEFYSIIEKQVELGYDTINLKNKFSFKWDRLILANNKEDINSYINEDCQFLNYRNDIDGIPPEKLSVIFIHNKKIIYHEDMSFKYSGFDLISGGFKFGFEENYNKPFKGVSSDSANFSIKKIDTRNGIEFVLKPI